MKSTKGPRVCAPVSGTETADPVVDVPGLVSVVDEVHDELDRTVYERLRCGASSCESAELARDDIELGSEGHVGVAVREGSSTVEHGHVIALVEYGGEDLSLAAVDDDVVVEVVDDE